MFVFFSTYNCKIGLDLVVIVIHAAVTQSFSEDHVLFFTIAIMLLVLCKMKATGESN